MKVVFSPSALRSIRSLPPDQVRSLVLRTEEELASFSRWTRNVKKLRGAPLYRLRLGDYRAIFEVKSDTVTVIEIVNRKDAYR